MSSLKLKETIDCENCGAQTRRTIFDGIRRGVQLGHFILLNFRLFQQLPRLTSLYFFSFLK